MEVLSPAYITAAGTTRTHIHSIYGYLLTFQFSVKARTIAQYRVNREVPSPAIPTLYVHGIVSRPFEQVFERESYVEEPFFLQFCNMGSLPAALISVKADTQHGLDLHDWYPER